MDEDAALVVLVTADGTPLIGSWPKRANLRKYIDFHLARADFTGKDGQLLTLRPTSGLGAGLIILAGLGAPAALTPLALERLGGNVSAIAAKEGFTAMTILAGADFAKALRKTDLTPAAAAAHIVTGLRLSQYKFTKYKSVNPDKKTTNVSKVSVVAADRGLNKALEPLAALTEGICLTRDLVTEPPNVINPTSFARLIKEKLEPVGIAVTIIDDRQARSMGMGGLVGVGQGSPTPPCLVIMEWAGSKPKRGGLKNIPVFVGKGMTFDTGGYSIKPAAGMVPMKTDMGGAATVVGAMYTLALQQAAQPAVGAVAIAENMVDANAYRPADILHMLSGKTVEVLNTDAEGRLVLADALTYVQRTYDPSYIIDLATLTGAVRVALGLEIAGVFANRDGLWSDLQVASASSGDKIWRLPLDKSFHRALDSDIADLANIGGWDGFGGSCTAAAFLEEFVDDSRPWAHIDIAGAVWTGSPKPTCPKGATGYGVRLLVDLLTKAPVKPKRKITRRKKAAV